MVFTASVATGCLQGFGCRHRGPGAPHLWTPPARASSSTRVRGRHLAFGADPATTMVVDFAVEGDLASARVEASTGTGNGVAVDASVNRVTGSQRVYGRGMLSGLTPGSDYHYRILVDGQPASRGTFTTAPASPAPFRFTAFGDQGTDSHSKAMLAQVGALKPLVHLLAGDLCYADTSGLGGVGDRFNSAIWDRWLDQNDAVAAALPWMSVPGNHEMEPGFGMHGYAGYLTRVFPGGTSPMEIPVATTFRIGAVGFVGLDGNDVSNEIPANRGWTQNAQTAWLGRTLANLRSGDSPVDFIVAFLHHAPYSTNNTHASEGGSGRRGFRSSTGTRSTLSSPVTITPTSECFRCVVARSQAPTPTRLTVPWVRPTSRPEEGERHRETRPSSSPTRTRAESPRPMGWRSRTSPGPCRPRRRSTSCSVSTSNRRKMPAVSRP